MSAALTAALEALRSHEWSANVNLDHITKPVEEAVKEIERLENHVAFLIKQRTDAMENMYCRCEAPITRCDDKGCRCELCGGLER